MFNGEILVGTRYRLNIKVGKALPIKEVFRVYDVKARFSTKKMVQYYTIHPDGRRAGLPETKTVLWFRQKCIEEVASDAVSSRKLKAYAGKSDRSDKDPVPSDGAAEV